MGVLPSGNLVKHNELVINILKDAIKAAEENKNMVTIGIISSYSEGIHEVKKENA